MRLNQNFGIVYNILNISLKIFLQFKNKCDILMHKEVNVLQGG